MKRIVFVPCLLILVLSLSVVHADPVPDIHKPMKYLGKRIETVGDVSRISEKFFKDHYKEYNKEKRCYLTQSQYGVTYCMPINTVFVDNHKDGKQYVYMMSMGKIHDRKDMAHHYGSLLDMYVIQYIQGGKYRLVAKKVKVEGPGSFGQGDSSDYTKFGPDTLGWTVTGGFSNQGYGCNNAVFFALVNG